MRMPFPKMSQDSEPESASAAEPVTPLNTLDTLNTLRKAGDALLTQTLLYGQLLRVEWDEEKNRLRNMFMVMLLGFACLLCLMFFAGGLVLALSWDTAYRIPALIALIALYGAGVALAGFRIQSLSARSSQAFAATREEFVADMALLKSRL